MEKFSVEEKQRIKLGDLIRKKRNEKKLSQGQLAYKTEINNADIHRIEKGEKKKINPYYLMKIAAALDLDYKDLYKIVGYMEEEEKKECSKDFDLENIEDTIRIPLYDSISAGCGITEGQALDFINVPMIKNPKGCFAVIVKGDSMEPTIPDNSIIIVRKGEEILNGQIGAFVTDNGAVVKRIQRTEKETILLSDNSKYLPIVITEDSLGYYECGRVINLLLNL